LDPGFSGAVLFRVAGDRSVIARGWADLDGHIAITPLTRFNLASLTKLLTSVAVCRLVERGTLRLSQSVADFHLGQGIRYASEITIDHLLTHTAGLIEQGPDTEEDDVVGGHWLAAARTTPLFRPGMGWAYSNVGYGVLGAIIESTTGHSFADVVEELVLAPAGMTETILREVSPDRSAIGYVSGTAAIDDQAVGNWRPATRVGRPKPYGYAWSTVYDLERLVDALASGALVEGTLADRILDGGVETGQPGRRAAFGMFHEQVADHSIATLSGAGPGISAWLDFVAEPEPSYLAIVLSNRPKPAAHLVGDRLRRTQLDPPSSWRRAREQPSAPTQETTQS
jgi:CubicO group peptidase (beta-lactamase class C family)